jgi:hypothetical protein
LQQNTMNMPLVNYGATWLPGEPFTFTIDLEHLAGHNLPSGASADRRMWLEVVAYDENGQVVLETGKIADGEVEEKPKDDPKHDPQLDPFRDYLTDAEGRETHMFWEAAKIDSDLMPYAIDPTVLHTARRSFTTNRSMLRPPARIEFWLRLRPMGIDMLQDLSHSGHLDPAVIGMMPTYTVMHQEALPDLDKQTFNVRDLVVSDCETYLKRFEQP